MIKHYFRIEIDGQPMRLYVNSKSKTREVIADKSDANKFASIADAKVRATTWGLSNYEIIPFDQDLGTVTNLAEILI